MSIICCPIAYYWTSMSILICRNSLRGVGGRRAPAGRGRGGARGGAATATATATAAAVSQELWPPGGALFQPAQEPNIPCRESLTSIKSQEDHTIDIGIVLDLHSIPPPRTP